MSTLKVNQLKVVDDRRFIGVVDLRTNIVKNYRSTYTGGQWNPDTNYNWVPGMFHDYTPLLDNSRIRVYCHLSYARNSGNAHGISHWIFYANGIERGRHSISGNHLEDHSCYTWDVPSWGANVTGRIGYQMRAYANDNHEVRPHCTQYWDGANSVQNSYSQFVIEEIDFGLTGP
jgi:hypothetical protein